MSMQEGGKPPRRRRRPPQAQEPASRVSSTQETRPSAHNIADEFLERPPKFSIVDAAYMIHDVRDGLASPPGFWRGFRERWQLHCHMRGDDPRDLPWALRELDLHRSASDPAEWDNGDLFLLALSVGMVTLSNEGYAKRFLDNWPSQLDIMNMIENWKRGAR